MVRTWAFLSNLSGRGRSVARETGIAGLCIIAVMVASSLAGCSQKGSGDLAKGQRMPAKTIEQVQEKHTDEWMVIEGVEGTAIGLSEGKPCIKVLTSSAAEQVRAKIPSMVEGYPVVVEQTGVFRALDEQ
jgi:predicted small lipoprotein YifL